VNLPRLTRIQQDGTHRLIPHRNSDRGQTALNRLAEDNPDLVQDLTELESATDPRLLGEVGRLPGIVTIELVSGFPLAHIVNAAFTCANPSGGRFNRPDRGAWYAALEMPTAQAEVAFHRARELQETAWTAEEHFLYVDYRADFRHEFHDLRDNHSRGHQEFVDCLDPNSYAASQSLALRLLEFGSAGIIYPSVRCPTGVCLACFRPPLVSNVREGVTVRFTFAHAALSKVAIENRN
jgi:RES domain-containing protein